MLRCRIFARFSRLTAALYHLGGICMIVVYHDNGLPFKAP
jgi:hypothetical protein